MRQPAIKAVRRPCVSANRQRYVQPDQRGRPQHASWQCVISPFQPGCRITVLYGKVLHPGRGGRQGRPAGRPGPPFETRGALWKFVRSGGWRLPCDWKPRISTCTPSVSIRSSSTLFGFFPIVLVPSKFTKGGASCWVLGPSCHGRRCGEAISARHSQVQHRFGAAEVGSRATPAPMGVLARLRCECALKRSTSAIWQGWFQWCPGLESNQRHCDFQSHALPTELPGHPSRRSTTGGNGAVYRGWIRECPAAFRAVCGNVVRCVSDWTQSLKPANLVLE